MLILDEINVALDYSLLALPRVPELLDARPPQVELVLTGRNAHQQVLQRDDLATEMRCIKHPYDAGIEGRKGIEY